MTTPAELPSPLTPADCDLQDFKFMPLDVARLRDSDMASEQTPEENWAAVLLWAAAWHQVPAGSIPDSDNWIAKAAGYLSRGRIDPHWKEVRTGAMRGFVLCSDGRWYHPVVCEKANESWISKLKQRLKTECARIKKHNDRHKTNIPFPEFDAWFAAGCPVGQPLPVPKDITPLSLGTVAGVPGDTTPLSLDEVMGVPGETPSKGQGEGQRQGELTSKALSGGAYDSSRESDDDRLPPRPQHQGTTPDARAVAICTLLTGAGVRKVTAFHPDVAVTWAQDQRVTDELLLAAVARAKETLGDEPFQVPYLRPIVVELLNPPAPRKPKTDDWAWKKSTAATDAKGRELGMFARGSESYDDFRVRIQAELDKRKGGKAA